MSRREFKKGLDTENSSVRRQDGAESLRKIKRDEAQNKKRGGNTPDSLDMDRALQLLMTDNPILGLRELGHITSDAYFALTDRIIPQYLPRLTQLVQCPQTLEAALWVIINLAKGSEWAVNQMMQSTLMPPLFQLLSTLQIEDEHASDCVWVFANLAGDSLQSRTLLLQNGVLNTLLALMTRPWKGLKYVAWAIRNLCRHARELPFEAVMPALPALMNFIAHEDPEISSQCAWALADISDDRSNNHERLNYLCQMCIFERLAEGLLLNTLPIVLHQPVVRIFGNLSSGFAEHTQLIVHLKLIPVLCHLLQTSPSKDVRKEVCWVFSNVGADTPLYLLEENAFPALAHALKTDDFVVAKEAMFAVGNMLINSTREQLQAMMQFDIIPSLCKGLTHQHDSDLLWVILQTLETIFRFGKRNAALSGKRNPALEAVEICNGLDTLEKLQMHDNQKIAELAAQLVMTYFAAEEDPEDDFHGEYDSDKDEDKYYTFD